MAFVSPTLAACIQTTWPAGRGRPAKPEALATPACILLALAAANVEQQRHGGPQHRGRGAVGFERQARFGRRNRCKLIERRGPVQIAPRECVGFRGCGIERGFEFETFGLECGGVSVAGNLDRIADDECEIRIGKVDGNPAPRIERGEMLRRDRHRNDGPARHARDRYDAGARDTRRSRRNVGGHDK